ncbi:hypothetical protein CH063_11956 [Colletotrichum higginsianum]|uniref:Uncharacterized protein n=1 Tax=Colletotrichum higginsianum (strain IMI 349063) TaxID=759273 RepID=H1VNG3_COLHI|nr:hypothetical protein CH063_11956 [Colletotrichum higginsianum]
MISATLDFAMELKAALHGATAIFAITDFWSAIQTEQVACAVRDEGIDVAVAARQLEESLWTKT